MDRTTVARVGESHELTKPLMMSSAQIVEVAESIGVSKSHQHVMRDIKVTLMDLYFEQELKGILPEKCPGRYKSANADSIFEELFSEQSVKAKPTLVQLIGSAFSWSRDTQGRIAGFMLDKHHAETLVYGYSTKLRHACIARLHELEKELAARSLPAPVAEPEPAPIEDKTIARVSKAIIVLDLLAGSKSYGLTQAEHRNGVHKLLRANGVPTDMLPAPTNDTYVGEGTATHYLKWRGSCLPVTKFMKMLQEEGLIVRHSRPSSKTRKRDGAQIIKRCWRPTTEGMRFCYEEPNAKSQNRDFTLLFYASQFNALMKLIAPRYEALIASGKYVPAWPKSENEKHAKEYRDHFTAD